MRGQEEQKLPRFSHSVPPPRPRYITQVHVAAQPVRLTHAVDGPKPWAPVLITQWAEFLYLFANFKRWFSSVYKHFVSSPLASPPAPTRPQVHLRQQLARHSRQRVVGPRVEPAGARACMHAQETHTVNAALRPAHKTLTHVYAARARAEESAQVGTQCASDSPPTACVCLRIHVIAPSAHQSMVQQLTRDGKRLSRSLNASPAGLKHSTTCRQARQRATKCAHSAEGESGAEGSARRAEARTASQMAERSSCGNRLGTWGQGGGPRTAGRNRGHGTPPYLPREAGTYAAQ